MFIPVSLASGAASVDIVANVTGNLVAQCAVSHKGRQYAIGESIPVAAGDPVRLSTTVTAYKEISVALGGKTYYWFVDLPKSLRYVEDLAFQRTAGTTYGALYHANGVSVPYTVTSAFTAGDAVASVDFVKKEIWFFNGKNEVKKLVVPDVPVAVVFAPRWSLADGVTTTAFVVAQSNIYKLNALFEITDTYTFAASNLSGTAIAASGDVNGHLLIATTQRLYTWNPATTKAVNGWLGYTTAHSVYVMADNTYIIGTAEGLLSQKADGTEKTVLIQNKGLFVGFALTETTLYAVDAYNRCLIAYDIAAKTYKTRYFDNIPRSVVINGQALTVGFMDSNRAVDVTMDLVTVTQRAATVKTFGASFLGDYVVTDLYSNAADVTLAEPTAVPIVFTMDDQPLDTPVHYQWVVDWDRPEYVRLGAASAVVKVNGAAFVDGYLHKGDVITIDVPGSSTYYDDRQVSFVGRRATTFLFRTAAKLYPDEVIFPDVIEAFPRYEYTNSYTVSGITDGFSADVVLDADDTDITFDVNNSGTFGQTGTIRNGDVVTVRAYLKKLTSKREAHIAYTGPNKDWHVFSWTLLTITPNGVTVRQESTDAQNRYHEIAPQPMVAQQEYRTGIQNPSPTCPVTAYGPADKMLQGTLVELNGNIAVHDYGAVQYATDAATHVMDERYATVTMAQVAAEIMLRDTVTQYSSEAVRREADAYYGFSYDTVPYPTPTSLDILAQYGNGTQNNLYQFTATVEKNVFQHIEPLSINVVQNVQSHIEMAEAAFDYRHLLHSQAIETEWRKTPSLSFVYGELDLAKHWMLNQVWSRVFIDAVYDEIFHHVPRYAIDAVTALRPSGDFVAINISFDLQTFYGMKKVDGAKAVLRRTTKSPSITVQYEHVRSNSILADMPSAEFVRESHRDNPISDLVTGFGSRAQAEAYFASLNLTGVPTYVQFNGKWAFTVAPVADSAICRADAPDPSGRRRAYGYLGGG
jgi:hypothetical protein